MDGIELPSIVVGDLYGTGKPRGMFESRWEVNGVGFDLALTPYEDWVDGEVTRRHRGRAPTTFRVEVRVSWTNCNYGGRRAWLHCQDESCERRVRLLHMHPEEWPPVFACRGCAGITYVSKGLTRHKRQLRKALAIRERLGGEPMLDAPFPAKPPRMHRTTYQRLCDEAVAAEAEVHKHLIEGKTSHVERLVNRLWKKYGLDPVDFTAAEWQRGLPDLDHGSKLLRRSSRRVD